ncbi:6388_t:CDS:2 [Diversispora eburnea]|uniref:6388_t:CDS:1 n=1 Tax=Diversispora eburnea TaxID=1213867 RepID=A0A9N9F114_9GLOM|nr:6388_t:CDS:2 [Diversispora eburnea]
MEGQGRGCTEQNTSYSQHSGHKYNHAEKNEFVGITISDDFSQKQLSSMPMMATSSSPSHSQLNVQNQSFSSQNISHRQEVLDGHGRRRSVNYIPNTPSSHYSQNQNISHHQRSLSGTNQTQPTPPIQNVYQTIYSNSQSSPNSHPTMSNSVNSVVSSSPNKSSQHSSSTTRDHVSKPDFRGSAFQRIRSKSDLAYRNPDSGNEAVSPLKSLTVFLTSTYNNVNSEFRYELSYNPRRVLTKPSKGTKNDGYDNEDSDYILYVNDILGSEEGQKYLILDILGQGTFGQVVKCLNLKTKKTVAVKIVKNKPAYFNQSMMEVTILELLNQTWDNQDQHHILRLLDTFIHRRHLCLVFELLSVNLYELIKQNQFRGLSTNLVRVFTAQLLDSLTVLNEARIIHCDLKPENVLLKNLESPTIKVIDFGSACHERQTVYTYIQSRFYRSPEVLLGYSSSIDMWSLGCIAVELFLGLPLFPGSSEYNQISRIVEILGVPPLYMIEVGKTAHEYFDRYINDHGQKKYRLKSMEQYMRENNCVEQPSKRYFSASTLPEIIKSYPIMRKGVTQKDIDKEMQNRLAFIDFVQGLLNLNPIERWSPQQAKLHPFITGEKFTGKFVPPMLLKSKTSIPPSSTSQSSSLISRMPSPSQYKPKTNTSPQAQHKNLTAHEMPSVKVTSHGTNHSESVNTQRLQMQQKSNKISSLTPKSSMASLRPRASTIGNIQVPPQIQRVAALVSPGNLGSSPGEYSRITREKDPKRLPQPPYPHLQLLQDQNQQLDATQFSVIVEGEDRRATDPFSNIKSNTNEVVGIQIGDDWNDKEGRRQKEGNSHKDERHQSVTSNSPVDIHNNGNNEKRLRTGVKMPGGMPNGISINPAVVSSGLDDSVVSSSGPTLHLTQQYHKKSLQQIQIEQQISVNVMSPVINQTQSRITNYRSSPSYDLPTSFFRNSPGQYSTPSSSPYIGQTNQSQGSQQQQHQLALPPPVAQMHQSTAYYQNTASSYEKYYGHLQPHRQHSQNRISPSTSPSYPPTSSPSIYGTPPSSLNNLSPQSSYFQALNYNRTSPSQTGSSVPQQSTVSNKLVNNDSHHHLNNNNHETKYNNRREINPMPYQMA